MTVTVVEDDLKLRLLAREVAAMRLGLGPEAALSVTRAAVERLAADARAGRPLVALKAAVRDEFWRRQAACVVEVAETLQPGDGMAEFTAKLRPAYERVVGYVPSVEGLVHDGLLVVADGDGRWNVSPAARKAARDQGPARGGTDAVPGRAAGVPAAVPGKNAGVSERAGALPAGVPASSEAARRALVEADLLAYPDDSVAARARRLAGAMGLKDRAARARIGAIVGTLRAAA
ncbi:hypothetical protein ABZX95_06155 [Streptomyces sp. NPDC004232]|uniref:hypothetical protein n=1 Tax=Streptomyces sp. NPDC004232 TaxID=3154454 RepID=UPI0033B27D2D